MAGKGKITRKEIASKDVFTVGEDFARSLQPGIEATEKWEAALRELKAVAIEYANVEQQFKIAEGRKEFLQIKQQEEILRKRTAEAIRAEQNALAAKQKAIISAIQSEKQRITLESKKNRVQRQSIKLTEKEKYELRILNRGKREAAVLSSKLSTEYEKQSIILTRLRRRYKDVALTQGKSGKEAKRLRKRILELDAALKKVDANVGQFQRNVGNYTKAMQNARAAAQSLASAMGVMGGAFLVAAVIKDAIQVIRDFEKQNATLAAILQVEREEMQGLTDDAVRLGETTVKTAGQVTQLQIAYARLGFEQQEILDLTESTISGSIAMNSEIDKTAELVGAVVNTLDDLSTTDAPQIIDILSLSTAKSALEFQKLETGLPIVAGAANAAGISFTRLVGLMGKLADSGIDISSSSTSLRNIFIESAAQGLNYEQILEKIKKSQDKLTAANDEFGKRASVSATILANNIDTTKELEEALDNAAGTAERMANEELDTLDGSIKLLRSAWEGYILKLNDSTEAGITLKDGIGFLAKNLDTIIPLIGYITKAWLLYKAAAYLASVQQKIMAASVAFSNRNLVLQRLGAIRAAQGLNKTSIASIRASLAFKKLGDVLKANVFGLVATGLAALIYYFDDLNESVSETVSELQESNEEFISHAESTINLNSALGKSAKRYDELKKKTKLNKDEQKELDKAIKDIAKHVPDAITQVDKYGNALEVNTEKVDKFVEKNNEALSFRATANITEFNEALKQVNHELDVVNGTLDENSKFSNNFIDIEGIGYVRRLGEELRFQNKSFEQLSDNQKAIYKEYVAGLERSQETIKKEIEQNEDVIASITGVKNARQLAEEEQKKADAEKEKRQKQAQEANALAGKINDELLKVSELRDKIKELREEQDELNRSGSNIKRSEEINNLIGAYQKEIDFILRVKKANKDSEKAAKERAAAEKKLRQDAFKLSEFSLKQQIKGQEEILSNQENSFEKRSEAIKEQSRLEIELAKLTAKNKFDESKKFTDKELEALITKGKVSKETLKKVGDEETLIIEQYQARRSAILNAGKRNDEAVEAEKIVAAAKKVADEREKSLNEEIEAENNAFLAKEGIYSKEEDAVELREKRIAEIKKRYAVEALETQVKAVEQLLESENISAEKRAEYEAKLAKLKADISDLNTQHFINNDDKEVKSVQEKAQEILEISNNLSDALSDLASTILDSKINKIDEEIAKEDEKFNKLLENENLTEEQRTALEEQRDATKERLEKKKQKEQRKQAILGKAFAALNIGLTTSQAVIGALAPPPVGLGPVAGIPLASYTAAIGAIQLAAALAAPIPKYAKGTDFHPGGDALVGEERPEVITEPNKAPYVVDRPTILDLPRGTKVTPSLEEYDKLMRASILSSVEADNRKLNQFQAKYEFNSNYDAMIVEARLTRKAIEKQKTNVIIKQTKSTDFEHELFRLNNTDWNT